MAYLTFTGSEENTCFKFIGANSSQTTQSGLISSSTSLISNTMSLISNDSNDCMDTCSFYSGPTDSAILAFNESFDNGEIAYTGSESCGSIAYSGGGETCGSVASASVSSSSSSMGGGCSYCC